MTRISTPQIEGNFQAAKWLKIQALVEPEELALLFNNVFEIYPLSGGYSFDQFPLKKGEFLSAYRTWIEALKEGTPPKDEELRLFNATAWVSSPSAIWLQEIPGKKYLARPSEPFLQCQVHQMGYSTVDGEFRPMVLSRESIFWGLQFSFPQVYQHPKTGEFFDVEKFDLFQSVRKWSREHTVATPMLVGGKRVNIPIRLGKGCFSWINQHPQLKAKGLSVVELFDAH
ncbi:MAG TPA: hypothetical protein VHL30_01815 [Chlamydiales bacterium]|jgi:hypothetical protein|nr:hypothetical protein [Chlamydiales bacterium]